MTAETSETGDAALAAVTAVLTDLAEVRGRLPVPAGQAEPTARILDRLSEEISEAAQVLRGVEGAASPAPAGPSFNPWTIVSMTTRQLARDGVKSRFGAESDLSAAIEHAAGLLDSLGIAAIVPADDSATSGQIQPLAADPRVDRARELMAEHHQPIAMSPGDLRQLLARYQRRVHGLLGVIEGGTSP